MKKRRIKTDYKFIDSKKHLILLLWIIIILFSNKVKSQSIYWLIRPGIDTLEVLSFNPSAPIENGIFQERSEDSKVILKEISYKNWLKHGSFLERYKDGGTKTLGYYNLNERDSTWITVYENSVIADSGKFLDGYRDGIWKSYYPNGNLKVNSFYKDGFKKGLWKVFHNNGVLKEQGRYVEGLKEGLWLTLSERWDTLLKANYADGHYAGDYKEYFSNGTLKISGYYDEWGRKSDEWIFYHSNGERKSKGQYIKGLKSGLWIYYYFSGYLQLGGKYRRGKRKGYWYLLDDDIDSSIIYVRYRKGKLLKTNYNRL